MTKHVHKKEHIILFWEKKKDHQGIFTEQENAEYNSYVRFVEA